MGWHGRLTPSICSLGADSVAQTTAAGRALADARSRTPECDGHGAECQFWIVASTSTGLSLQVISQRIDFWHRRRGPVEETQAYFSDGSDGVARSPQ